MDLDMHYYGTYALARAAGIQAEVALRIATAAEFVDDSTQTEVIVHPDGARFRGEATAHHPTALAAIRDLDDQVAVWVPFHFLPGAEGASQSQKLKCVKNSALAKKMVDHHLELADAFYAVELMGITAHVYADTFAHYGFSGVSSRVNRVLAEKLKPLNADPFLVNSLDGFFQKYSTQGGLLKNFRNVVASVVSVTAGEISGALGHGAVATFPDQPYLEWRYDYEMPDFAGQPGSDRQNANDYEEGAEALYNMFVRFVDARPIFADPKGRFGFEEIRPLVRSIVRTIGPRDARINAWKKALDEGKFCKSGPEAVIEYSHDEWRAQTAGLGGLPTPQDATQIPAYRFHFAAALHRHYVLRELLPQHGIYML